MHELSIATSVVDVATQAAVNSGAQRVTRVMLRVGALSCVHRSALEYCYEMATKDTMLEGSDLVIHVVPIAIHCAVCDRDVELPSIQTFRCPICDTPSADIRQGQELDVEAIEVQDAESPHDA